MIVEIGKLKIGNWTEIEEQNTTTQQREFVVVLSWRTEKQHY